MSERPRRLCMAILLLSTLLQTPQHPSFPPTVDMFVLLCFETVASWRLSQCPTTLPVLTVCDLKNPKRSGCQTNLTAPLTTFKRRLATSFVLPKQYTTKRHRKNEGRPSSRKAHNVQTVTNFERTRQPTKWTSNIHMTSRSYSALSVHRKQQHLS